MDDFTARAVGMVLIDFALVFILLAGGFLVINLGLMSRRREDRVGSRTPSDLGILKNVVWPEQDEGDKVFPAQEGEEEEGDEERRAS